ncbi:MAG: histidine kinase [Actinocatenispora sp.]
MAYGAEAPIGGWLFERLGRLHDRFGPVAVGVVIFTLSVVAVDGFLGVPSAWDEPWVLSCAVACGVSAALARWRRWPVFLVAAVAGIAALMWPATVVASYYAGTTLRRRPLLGYLCGATGCMAAAVAVNSAIGGYRAAWWSVPNSTVLLLLIVGLPVTVGLWVAARRQLLAQWRYRAERLEREQAARAEQARATERARIAREMHDVVAHRVALMVLHAGALEVNAPDGRTAEGAELIRSTGREALANLREVLGILRSPVTGDDAAHPQPVLADLDALLSASRAVGLPVTLRVEGEPALMPDMVQRTAYRVVQEALTNVHKHAGPVATEVLLRQLPDRLVLRVANQPAGAPVDRFDGSGLGLLGLRERVELLGGSWSAGPEPSGGFVVRAELPTAGPRPLPGEQPGGTVDAE